jgi:hypothetical protein
MWPVASILMVLSRTGPLAPKVLGLQTGLVSIAGGAMYAGLISVVWAGIKGRF